MWSDIKHSKMALTTTDMQQVVLTATRYFKELYTFYFCQLTKI